MGPGPTLTAVALVTYCVCHLLPVLLSLLPRVTCQYTAPKSFSYLLVWEELN